MCPLPLSPPFSVSSSIPLLLPLLARKRNEAESLVTKFFRKKNFPAFRIHKQIVDELTEKSAGVNTSNLCSEEYKISRVKRGEKRILSKNIYIYNMVYSFV